MLRAGSGRRSPRHLLLLLYLLLAGPVRAEVAQPNDYHQHLLSPAVAHLIGGSKPFFARDLIKLMDEAGIHRAVVLSLAYQFGNPNRAPVADEYNQVRAENDWASAQVAQYPDRLVAFCGVDPLRDYALAEIERCSHDKYLRAGLKLHFGNSDVDLDRPEHVAKLRRVFGAADRHGMAIVVHLHANIDHHRPYGEKEAQVFLNELLPQAPHVVIQIAHMCGGGGFDDPATDRALTVFLQAIAHQDRRTNNLFFDISGVAGLGEWESKKQLIAKRIREAGVQRILFGSDGAWTDFTPAKALAAYRQLPLTPDEFRTIDTNVPSYMRRASPRGSTR